MLKEIFFMEMKTSVTEIHWFKRKNLYLLALLIFNPKFV